MFAIVSQTFHDYCTGEPPRQQESGINPIDRFGLNG